LLTLYGKDFIDESHKRFMRVLCLSQKGMVILMKMAEEADNTPIPDGLDIPHELSRREERIIVIRAAKEEIERRALERFEEEKHEYEDKMAARAKREEETGCQ
jgi:hypothetical protein